VLRAVGEFACALEPLIPNNLLMMILMSTEFYQFQAAQMRRTHP
jgi:hypothetical protein